ncbi:MAG: hypothetical protein NZ750_01590 [Anaerolineae bacterium]|nr:hypothetical protein [Anaerolineae bacterium]MDW8173277.1 hypothetical protein [Anaerolineae bacterium]
MSRELLFITFMVTFGVIFGWLTHKAAIKREKITTKDPLALAFHYIASAIMAALTPGVLGMVIFLDIPLTTALLIAVAMFAIAFVFMLPFANIELPALVQARAAQEERGWTEKDARESGL